MPFKKVIYINCVFPFLHTLSNTAGDESQLDEKNDLILACLYMGLSILSCLLTICTLFYEQVFCIFDHFLYFSFLIN